MSNYGHFTGQYYGNKINFPTESFLIAGISYYQTNLVDINLDSNLTLKPEPENKYDSKAIQILFNDKCVGYVPNNDFFKVLCTKNINSNLKIINIKRESENKNVGIRVILEEYYTDDLKNIGLF
tara:strand:- start:314 stop:685 length:372 start_codon:yes stop_codon:yes gene_type:complete